MNSTSRTVGEEQAQPSRSGSSVIPILTGTEWCSIGIVSVIIGLGIYATVTSLAYYTAVQEVGHAPAKLFERVVTNTRTDTVAIALGSSTPSSLFARSIGVEFASSEDPLGVRLANAFQSLDEPIVEVVATFLRPGDAKKCEALLRQRMANGFARLLVGWPGDTSRDLDLLEKATHPTTTDAKKTPEDLDAATNAECDSYASSQVAIPTLRGLVLNRTEALTGRDLAVRILGADACIGGGTHESAERRLAECRIVQGLLEAVVATESAKQRRMWVNFFWGWERLAVIVLFIAIVIALFSLRTHRRPLEKQAESITDWLRQAELSLATHRGLTKGDARREAESLYDRFRSRYGVPALENTPATTRRDGKYLADSEGLCLLHGDSPTALRDLLDANREGVNATDRSYLRQVVELHTQALSRQRAFINALITAFPAIGLVATLHGLIIALSRAGGIVAGSEADRFSATEFVTGILSSSFATTMLALTAMAICMLFNTGEEHREADLLEDTHRRINAVFWPGR